jgi:hypothetical protein
MVAEWFVDSVVPKFGSGTDFPPWGPPCGGLGEQGHTGVECVCAEIGRDRGLYWADPVTRTSLPFSSHKLSCVGTTDSHWPRDINLKSLHEAAHRLPVGSI